ncbi:putative uncharacterized protein [Clostridium sp. CAG:1013]|nr:putative uncharacterized protein [Clostridium sp. CAG:1013]
MKNYCGLDCAKCPAVDNCPGCVATEGKPYGGTCVLGECGKAEGCSAPGSCFSGKCPLKEKLCQEFNQLNIPDMEKVTDLNALPGFYINLEYTLPGGQKVKFWDDKRVYLGNQICKQDGSGRCFGLTADENHLLVCEYGDNGSDPEIVAYQRRNKK